MKLKNMSDSKKLVFISLVVLVVGAAIYGLFEIAGYDEKSKSYVIIGMGIAFIFFIISSIIRLKRDGVLHDERDDYIEKESNATAFTLFQIILAAIALLTYKLDKIEINISGFTFLLFFIMWIVYGITYFFVKRRS